MTLHWKARLKAKCAAIVTDMESRFEFRHVHMRNNRTAHACVGDDGSYEVHCAPPTGLVSLAIYLHEVAHVANRDCHPSRKTDLHSESRAWGWAKSMMEQHGIPWTESVSNYARAALTSHIRGSEEKIEPNSPAAAIIRALTSLDKAGI